MAKIFCSSTGSNTAPYETWAKAATTFTLAVGAATSSGDIIAMDAASPPADIGASTTWTFLANIFVVASTNSGTDTITPTIMGASTWLGHASASSYGVTFAGAFNVKLYGLTVRTGVGSGGVSFVIGATDGSSFDLEDCYFWPNASPSARVTFGSVSSSANSAIVGKNVTFRFSSAGGAIAANGAIELIGGGVSSAGTAPTTLLPDGGGRQTSFRWTSADLSHVTGTLVGSQTGNACEFHFVNPKLGSGVTPMAAQAPANKSSARVYIYGGATDGTDGMFAYYDALGSIVTDSTVKFTGDAAGMSWKVTTTANASAVAPFVSPWIDAYHAGTTSITPRLEILRDGSATAYKDSEVFGEFMSRVTASSPLSTRYTDRQTLADLLAGTAGTDQAAGADTWDGENATHWAGKVDAGSALTPAEPGRLLGRICVAAPSVTDLYVDPRVLF